MRTRWVAGCLGCWALWRSASLRWSRRQRSRRSPTGRRSDAAAAGAEGVQVPAVRDPHARQRPAGDDRPAPRAAGGHDAAADACRRGAGSGRQARRRRARGAPARSGHDHAERAADRRADRLHRRRARHRVRHRPDLRQRGRDEGFVRRGDGSGGRRRAQSGVRARGDRAAEGAGDLVAAASATRIRTTSRRCCSTGWSTASIPTGCRAAARRRR